MNSEQLAKDTIKSIKEAGIEADESVIVFNTGNWIYSNPGCQPVNTQAIGYDDLHVMPRDELETILTDFFEAYK